MYWFYIRSSMGGFYDAKGIHYSQILKCEAPVTTPGAFGKANAVGPFSSYMEAANARKAELELAIASGNRIIARNAICDHRWA